MKKYFIVLIILILLPIVVFAEECEKVNDPYCTGQSCLTSLQSKYNTWNTTGNTGKACINVIAVKNGNSKSYLSGKNPSNNYKCSDGSLAVSKLIYSALPDEEDASACSSQTCYVPEVWLMDCGTTGSNGSTNTGNNTSNNSGSSNTGTNTGSSNNGNISTNDDGQITGTTDTSETGVETYFIVLFVMMIISYLILTVSKKKNLFKNI